MSKLPLEELKEKYIPVSEFPEKFGISTYRIMKLVREKKILCAEFKVPGATRRTLHVNYEEVLPILDKEDKDESHTGS